MLLLLIYNNGITLPTIAYRGGCRQGWEYGLLDLDFLSGTNCRTVDFVEFLEFRHCGSVFGCNLGQRLAVSDRYAFGRISASTTFLAA